MMNPIYAVYIPVLMLSVHSLLSKVCHQPTPSGLNEEEGSRASLEEATRNGGLHMVENNQSSMDHWKHPIYRHVPDVTYTDIARSVLPERQEGGNAVMYPHMSERSTSDALAQEKRKQIRK